MVNKSPAMTPVMRQFARIKAKYPDALVLFRMGDFYETFEEDARIASRILNITLTKRANGKASTVPLAGFPHHALDSYLHKLLKAGLKVAICEQVEDPAKAKGIVKREVVEVVTPGTTVSERFLENKENNYLVAISSSKQSYGLASIDFSTGEFFISEYNQVNDLIEHLQALKPAEIIIPEDQIELRKLFPFFKGRVTEFSSWCFEQDYARQKLLEHFQTTTLKGFGITGMEVAVGAAGAILQYLSENFFTSLKHITSIAVFSDSRHLLIDGYTRRNLELFESMSGVKEATLIHILDQTITAAGGRLLRQWLAYPLTLLDEINSRLDAVEFFFNQETLTQKIGQLLRNTSDGERILSKISTNRVTPKDLIGLSTTLRLVPEIASLLNNSPIFSDIIKELPEVKEICELIEKTLVAEPPASTKEGGYIRSGIDQELDELRNISLDGKNWILNLQSKERERLQIPSLKVGYNRVFGYYIEVTKAHLEKVPQDYIRKQTLVNSERFITEELKEFEEKILTAEEKIIEIESRIFNHLKAEILSHAAEIKKNLHFLALIDVYQSLGALARENDWCRPELNESTAIIIKNGRHPVVEALLPPGEKFVPNDLDIDTQRHQIQIITGPNMAGKSTYLRQIGLIVILAQMGSFVPASNARIGIVDRLFTRVGASDNVALGESTFLSEMTETANILNNATSRSLILLDEIGRGTATYDGLAIAWAVTEYIHNNPKIAARTLFATHYHELTELEKILPRVVNTNVAVKEYKDRVIFLRKIIPGSCDKSYGIHVAQMAGIPPAVVQRAREILANLTPTDPALPSEEDRFTKRTPVSAQQLNIFSPEYLIKSELEKLDIENMTPLEALNRLHQLKKRLKEN